MAGFVFMLDFTYLWNLWGMDNLEEKATERILLEPYKYLLQLPGKTFWYFFLRYSMVLNKTMDLMAWWLVVSKFFVHLIHFCNVLPANSQLSKRLQWLFQAVVMVKDAETTSIPVLLLKITAAFRTSQCFLKKRQFHLSSQLSSLYASFIYMSLYSTHGIPLNAYKSLVYYIMNIHFWSFSYFKSIF